MTHSHMQVIAQVSTRTHLYHHTVTSQSQIENQVWHHIRIPGIAGSDEVTIQRLQRAANSGGVRRVRR